MARDDLFFTLKREHIKLLRNMYVGWDDCEFGAPEIDPKRPYGNSFVEGDIAEILGLKLTGDENGDYDEEELAYLQRLHSETQTALQIVLSTGKFKTGKYVNDGYGTAWKLKK